MSDVNAFFFFFFVLMMPCVLNFFVLMRFDAGVHLLYSGIFHLTNVHMCT